MAVEEVIDLMSSRAFLGFGVPALSILAEWIIRLSAKPDDEPTFAWADWDFGMSLIATAFVSVPALLAARAAAIEGASGGADALDASTFALGAGGLALIAFVAMLLGRYDRTVGRRYRTEDHGVLTPILGTLVQLAVGGITLSLVYVLTPRTG